MRCADGTIGSQVLTVKQSFLTFPLELSGFAAVAGSTVSADAFAKDRAVELEDVTIAVRFPQRSVRVQLDISNFGPSRHNNLLLDFSN